MTDISAMLKDALAEQGAPAAPITAASRRTGRSGAGNLRNFKAMNDEKLLREAQAIMHEDNDPEALAAVNAVLSERGL